MKSSLALLALVPTTLAHFVLNYPPSLGFNDDNESQEPCGGFSVDLSNTTDSTNATVDSFAMALMTTHPQSQFLFRATLSTSAPYNWTNLLPVVTEMSIGDFCLPNLRAPSDFAGQPGLIQITQDGPDGILYQCAVVNFVTGSNTTVGSNCKNATGLTATITNEQDFTNASSTGSSGSSPSATSSQSAATTAMQNTGLLGLAFGIIGAVFMT